MFGDLKKQGCDLARTRMRNFLRLSRLVLAVELLYVWLLAFGAQTIKKDNTVWSIAASDGIVVCFGLACVWLNESSSTPNR